MAVRFACQFCDKPLKVLDEKIGKKVVCNGCGKISKVPETDSISMEHMGVRQRANTEKAGHSYEELISSYGNSDYAATKSKINAFQSFKLMMKPIVIGVIILLALIGFYYLGTSMIGG